MAAHSAVSIGNHLHDVAGKNNGRIPIPLVNPLGAFSYAWRIADGALRAGERGEGLKKGLMNEPVGAGVC